MYKTGKNRFLLTTAVLLAGVSLASAQGMGGGGGGNVGAGGGAGAGGGISGGGAAGGGASTHERSGGGMSAGGRAGGGAAAHEKSDGGMRAGGGASAKEPSAGSVTQGRAGGGAEGRAGLEGRAGMKETGRDADRAQHGRKDQTVGQGRAERDHQRQSERPQDQSRGRQNDQTVGQSRGERDQTRQSDRQGREKNNTTTQNRNAKEGVTTGANTGPGNTSAQGQNAQQGQRTTTGANTRDQINTRDQNNAQAQDQSAARSMSGRVSLTAQQQTTLQQSVLNSRNVARVNANAINFRVNTGVFVPRNISVVSVAAFPALIDIYPDFRDHSFFVVDDEIVVLDRSRRIVDVVPAGPRAHFARGSGTSVARHQGTSDGSIAALDLSPQEIRVVQQVLIDQGLLTGEADGVLGTRTHEALITFQRQQGIRATGSIDTNTVAALGVSDKISATQGQSTTVGQDRNGQRPATQQNTTGQNAGQGEANAPAQQNQPPTTGETGTQPPAGQTTGQAGSQQPSGQTTGQAAPPAQGNNPPSANEPSARPNQNNAPAASTGHPSQNPPSR